jgi:hypothetical protein
MKPADNSFDKHRPGVLHLKLESKTSLARAPFKMPRRHDVRNHSLTPWMGMRITS